MSLEESPPSSPVSSLSSLSSSDEESSVDFDKGPFDSMKRLGSDQLKIPVKPVKCYDSVVMLEEAVKHFGEVSPDVNAAPEREILPKPQECTKRATDDHTATIDLNQKRFRKYDFDQNEPPKESSQDVKDC